MIQIPLYLAVAQWALLVALGVLVIVMFRQLGRMLSGASRAAGLGPAAGSPAEPLAYTRPGEQRVRHLRPGDGQPVLVAFVDPTCPSCESLVGLLDQAKADGDLTGLRTLLLISDPPSYLRISPAFQSTDLEIGRPAERSGLDYYQVSATPLLVAIDGAGIVKAAGSATRIAEVRAFAQACVQPASKMTPTVTPVAAANGE
jgi:hypothetical protein